MDDFTEIGRKQWSSLSNGNEYISANELTDLAALGDVIDMNDDIAAMPGQKAGCLVAAHVVVGIHTAYISVLALDRHDRDSKL